MMKRNMEKIILSQTSQALLKEQTWLGKSIAIFMLILPFIAWGDFMYPFITLKTAVFIVFIQVLFAILFWKNNAPEFKKWKSPLTYLLGIALLSMLISSINGVDFLSSFYGTVHRMEGFILYFYLFLFFLLLKFSNKETSEKILWYSAIASGIIGFLMILESLFPNFIGIYTAQSATFTIGNSLFGSQYLLLNFFIILHLIRQKNQKEKLILGILATLNVIPIIMLARRGVMLGLFAGLFFLLIRKNLFENKELQKKIHRLIIGMIVIGSIILITAYAYRDSDAVRNNRLLNQLFINRATVNTRILFWEYALKGIQEKPLLGWGLNNYSHVFFENLTSKMLNYGEQNSDRAHNLFLEAFITTGFIGGILAILIFGYALIKSWKDPPVFSLFVAYLTQGFFEPDAILVLIMLYLSFGLVENLNAKERKLLEPVKPVESKEKKIRLNGALLWSGKILLIFMTAVIVFKTGEYLYGNFYTKKVGDDGVGILLNEEAINKNHKNAQSFPALQKEQYFYNYYHAVSLPGVATISLKTLYNLGKELEKKFPDNFVLYEYLTDNSITLQNMEGAKSYIAKMKKLNPNGPKIPLAQSRMKYLEGGTAAKKEELEKLKIEFPENFMIYWELVRIYAPEGNFDLAEKNALVALNSNSPLLPIGEVFSVTDKFGDNGKYEQINRIYKKMTEVEYYKYSAPLMQKLAASYAILGDKENAKKAAFRAMELDPALRETGKHFIQKIETQPPESFK